MSVFDGNDSHIKGRKLLFELDPGKAAAAWGVRARRIFGKQAFIASLAGCCERLLDVRGRRRRVRLWTAAMVPATSESQEVGGVRREARFSNEASSNRRRSKITYATGICPPRKRSGSRRPSLFCNSRNGRALPASQARISPSNTAVRPRLRARQRYLRKRFGDPAKIAREDLDARPRRNEPARESRPACLRAKLFPLRPAAARRRRCRVQDSPACIGLAERASIRHLRGGLAAREAPPGQCSPRSIWASRTADDLAIKRRSDGIFKQTLLEADAEIAGENANQIACSGRGHLLEDAGQDLRLEDAGRAPPAGARKSRRLRQGERAGSRLARMTSAAVSPASLCLRPIARRSDSEIPLAMRRAR